MFSRPLVLRVLAQLGKRYIGTREMLFRQRDNGDLFEIALQIFERPLPSIALVGHQALQHGERFARALFRRRCEWLIFHGAGEGRDRTKSAVLGEVAANLRIGIWSGLL